MFPALVTNATAALPLLSDHVVVGCGGIGSATLHYLAKNNERNKLGQKILGVEQFGLGHANGSSHDRSRAIRYFYHHVEYLDMVRHSFDLWHELERETNLRIVHQCGVAWFASTSDRASLHLVDTCHEIMQQHPSEELVRQFQLIDEVWLAKNYPQLKFPSDTKLRGVYDPLGGFVDPVTAVTAFQQCAQRAGAEIWEHCSVVGITEQPSSNSGDKTYLLTVKRQQPEHSTSSEGEKSIKNNELVQILTRNLYLCTGPWTNQVLQHLGFQLPITVTQEQVMYCDMPQSSLCGDLHERPAGSLCSGGGVWFYEFGDDDMKSIYGFPSHTGPHDDEYIPPKIALHAKTDVLDQSNIMGSRDFGANPAFTDFIRTFLQRHVPALDSAVLRVKRCLYSVTPDQDIVVDNCSFFGHSNVYVFLGTGQGFKFAPLVGKYFALSGTRALVMQREKDEDDILSLMDTTGFVKLNRPGMLDKTYKQKKAWL